MTSAVVVAKAENICWRVGGSKAMKVLVRSERGRGRPRYSKPGGWHYGREGGAAAVAEVGVATLLRRSLFTDKFLLPYGYFLT